MIRLFDRTGAAYPLTDIENFCLLRNADGSIRMSFDIDPAHPLFEKLAEECELEYGENLYLIKKIKDGSIECDLNFDFLKTRMFKNFDSGSVTLSELLYEHLPDDWTVINDNVTMIHRTTTLDFGTDYDIIMSSMNTYGVYLEWEIKNKTVKVYLQNSSETTGEYVTDELNLRSISYQGDSLSFITRLYAYGKDGLSFADINDGKEYVDNNTYSSKVICGYWQDDRYTDAESLLNDTQERLDGLAYPIRSYECDVVDLAKIDPQYDFLKFKLHKNVMLIDNQHHIKVLHRIVQYKEYPDEPTRNVITLSRVPATVSHSIQQVASMVDDASKTSTSNYRAAIRLNQLITNSMGMYFTAVPQDNGSEIYYMHDNPSLEASETIYTITSNGYAYTNNGWNGGNPVWQYGEDKDGNAIFNKVNAFGIEIVNPSEGYITRINPEMFEIVKGIQKILSLGENGLDIYNGSLTIFSGNSTQSDKVLYLDEDGNAAFSGYLTQINSITRARIGQNEYNYEGFFIYKMLDDNKRSDGTYSPYIEFWQSTAFVTFISALNGLTLSYKNKEGTVEAKRLSIDSTGGTLFGKWDFDESQVFTKDIGTKGGVNLIDDENNLRAHFYISTTGNACLMAIGTELHLGIGNYSSIDIKSTGGLLKDYWDFDTEQKFTVDIGCTKGFVLYDDYQKVGSFYKSSNKYPCFNSDIGNPMRFLVTSVVKMEINSGGGKLYGTWYGTSGQAVTSDRNAKHDIEPLPDIYSILFDSLIPVRYKYNDGESDRYHTGFIAQDVETAIANSGLNTKDFAGYIVDSDNNYYLRYEEFIALTVKQVQTLKQKNTELENRIASLEAKIKMLLGSEESQL